MALPALVLGGLLAPANALAVDQPTVPVTVTIDSVTSVAGGPFSLIEVGGAPDFFARVNIDNSWLPDGPRIDNMSAIAPGWTFTRTVPRAVVPIRIEIYDFDGLTSELVDVDPAVCPPSPVIGGGCATLALGRPAFDFKGVDISLNAATSVVIPVDATGDASSMSACPTGTEDQTATLCFTITIGAPNPILVTKRTDGLKAPTVPGTTFGVCTTTDCSLREALFVARDGDTIQLQAFGHPYELTLTDPGDPFDPTDDVPGHLKIERANLRILGPATGATIQQKQANWRVFDVHPGASAELRNLTITGGTAGDDNSSTALPGHRHGGGIHNHGAVSLVNVTITGNHAPSASNIGGGGGFYNAGVASLTNVTIADNDATVLGGGWAGSVTAATFKNTLIANNTAPAGNCGSSPIDDGGNLQFPNASCGSAIPTAAKNPIGAAASVGALVYLLPAGSPAIDAGTNAGCPGDDEIGEGRPADGNGDGVVKCDAGATEYDPNGLGVIHQPLDSSTGQTGPVELTFDNVTAAGTTTLTTSSTGPAPPAAFRRGNPSVYYDIGTAAAFTGGVRVCIDYTGTAFVNEADLKLFHRVGASWQDKTVSLDTSTDVICARTTSFSVFAIFQANQKPVGLIVEPAGGYSLVEGGSVILQGGGSDADGDPLTYTWSPGTDLDDPNKAAPLFSPRDDGDRTLTLTVSDPDTSSTPVSVTIKVLNAAPTVSIVAPVGGTLYRRGTSVGLTVSFSDAGVDDVHTCSIAWDDGTPAQAGVVAEAAGAGTCTQSRVFAGAGVYTIQATVDDGDGGAGSASTMVVVYDPRAGSVTGGGSINSPAGAYRPNPTLTGSATFSFSSLYQTASATVPTGSAVFQLAIPAVSFVSTSHEWLVVTGAKAQLRGVGTINGRGNFGFLLTAIDGQVPGGGGSDRFRMKIWDRSAGNAIVYDNVLDPTATDDIDLAKPAPIVGSVVIVKGT